MINKPDWEKTKQKYVEYWNKENHDRPLLGIAASLGKKIPAPMQPDEMIDRWLDTEYVIQSARRHMENTWYGAESYPNWYPNLGPDIFGATYGAEFVFEETTSYSIPFIKDWADYPELTFDHKNKWWQKILEMTQAGIADAKGDYLVSLTDFHAGADGLVSIRGPELLAMDIYDEPEAIKKASMKMFRDLVKQIDETFAMTQTVQDGTSNWMGLWHPEKWYVTSCDFSTMLSVDMFNEFILPELQEELKWLDNHSIYHLDGPGALRHLDVLLQQENLNGVQWVYGAGQPTAAHWIPTLKKIQDAGKLIHVEATLEDLPVLFENLKPEGVFYNVGGVSSVEEGQAVVKAAEKAYHKKIF